MKMSKELYTSLKDKIQNIKADLRAVHDNYIKNGLSEKRFRWDLFWQVRRQFQSDDFNGLLDSHIDTALRQIVKEVVH